jgi:hypothetical protein
MVVASGTSVPFPPRGRSKLRVLFVLAAIVAVLAFGVAIALAASDGGEASRPQISGWFDKKTATLTAEITASNLPSDGRLAVKVDLQTVSELSGIDDPRPWDSRGSLPQERAYIGADADGDVRHELKVPILVNGPYSHIVIEATTGDGQAPCIELPAPQTPDDKTACMFIPLL